MPPKNSKRKAPPPRKSKKEESSSEEEEFDSLAENSSEEEISFSEDEEENPKPTRPTSSRSTATRNVPRRSASKSISYLDKSEEEDEDEEEEEEEEEDEGSAPQKKLKIEETGVFNLTWSTPSSTLYVMTSPDIKPSSKVVGFDMDGTLIDTKSGAKFPKNRGDWQWLYKEVPEKLKSLHKDGYSLVIFTNQAGIEKNKQAPGDIKGKIIDICKDLGFPIHALVAAATDANRKPNTTMWDHFSANLNGGVEVDLKQSFFIGDAGGRPKEWAPGKGKDFSCSDRAFAHNTGLTFRTPEEFFLDEKAVPFEWDSIDPSIVLANIAKDTKAFAGDKPLVSKSPELIVFVGRPASGKSTFARKHFVPNGYVHINQDTLGTKPKCIKAAREALSQGKSVIVDNTNPTAAVRSEYTALAKEAGVPFRCFVFETDPDLSYHLNFYREKIQGVRRIPDVGFNMFKSKFQEPSDKEGFVEIKKITWVPDFESDNHKRLFLQRT